MLSENKRTENWKTFSDLEESTFSRLVSPIRLNYMFILPSGWHPCGFYILLLNKWSYSSYTAIGIKVLKHGIDQLLSILCFRCVQCFWILKCSLAQWLKGLFTMPSMFLSISSVDWLHWEVSNECCKTKNHGSQSGHSQRTQSDNPLNQWKLEENARSGCKARVNMWN